MGNRTAVLAVLALLALPMQANADDRLVRFDGGIGVVPVRTSGANLVRNVNPGGIPWVISRLTADVRTDGRISVDGRGLLLGGGDNVGTNGGATVFARLFCGAGNGIQFDSQTVPLSADGDFRIDGQLPGLLQQTYERPVLLIVNSANPVWFAAGIPRQ